MSIIGKIMGITQKNNDRMSESILPSNSISMSVC